MKKLDYKKYLPKVVVVILCLFFVVGVIWGANNILEMEGTLEPEKAYPDSPKDCNTYLDAAIQTVLNEKPKLETSEKCSIDNSSILAEPKNDLLLTAANSMTDGLEDAIEKSHQNASVDFSGSSDDVLSVLKLNKTDILSSQCQCDYYECPYCHKYFSKGAYKCPECGGNKPLELKRDEFVITITLADGSDSFERNFVQRTPEEIDAVVKESCGKFFTYERIIPKYSNAKIVARINRNTDKLTRLEFSTDVSVTALLCFTGTYSYVDDTTASFTLKDTVTYKITWPSLKLDKEEMSVEPKNTDVIKATLTCDDPVKYDVRWKSSDESIATVDNEGYVKAGKNAGVAVISAEFDFNGVTYSDSCEVYVKTSVEGIDISKRRLTLKVGETFKQTATVSPKKATVKTVKWFSEDEKVVLVSADGTITAVSEGNTVIYAVSDDGYYKASCKVEVAS